MESLKQIFISIAEYLTQFGHIGIFIGMTLESACIPIPSEIILPLGGYLVYRGIGSIFSMTLVATLGCYAGSVIAYVAGYFGGRPFILKYGKYLFISKHDFERAERFFQKRGEITIFVSRLLPVIRTFISLPAGIAKMNFIKFSAYTILGSFPWCLLFVYLGKKLGDNWRTIEEHLKGLDYFILVILIIAILLYVAAKLFGRKKRADIE
ncbi:DedA family protein [Caldicellulosiruptor morganii]|uniref:DedA family protein n=1 Tax=Caldicellulosiruptor morganii TaxID=1387555 RepID=A0ABY7BSA0_9FIRM|nr:DedA family protein [Caldicellulosiruptor morganii]WAM34566.1 DedA family protein [Caldicellulosiruptor morganii]